MSVLLIPFLRVGLARPLGFGPPIMWAVMAPLFAVSVMWAVMAPLFAVSLIVDWAKLLDSAHGPQL